MPRKTRAQAARSPLCLRNSYRALDGAVDVGKDDLVQVGARFDDAVGGRAQLGVIRVEQVDAAGKTSRPTPVGDVVAANQARDSRVHAAHVQKEAILGAGVTRGGYLSQDLAERLRIAEAEQARLVGHVGVHQVLAVGDSVDGFAFERGKDSLAGRHGRQRCFHGISSVESYGAVRVSFPIGNDITTDRQAARR